MTPYDKAKQTSRRYEESAKRHMAAGRYDEAIIDFNLAMYYRLKADTLWIDTDNDMDIGHLNAIEFLVDERDECRSRLGLEKEVIANHERASESNLKRKRDDRHDHDEDSADQNKIKQQRRER